VVLFANCHLCEQMMEDEMSKTCDTQGTENKAQRA